MKQKSETKNSKKANASSYGKALLSYYKKLQAIKNRKQREEESKIIGLLSHCLELSSPHREKAFVEGVLALHTKAGLCKVAA